MKLSDITIEYIACMFLFSWAAWASIKNLSRALDHYTEWLSTKKKTDEFGVSLYTVLFVLFAAVSAFLWHKMPEFAR